MPLVLSPYKLRFGTQVSVCVVELTKLLFFIDNAKYRASFKELSNTSQVSEVNVDLLKFGYIASVIMILIAYE